MSRSIPRLPRLRCLCRLGSPRLSRIGLLILIFLIGLSTNSLRAVEPDEVLDDPALEARARAISSELRCVVCQNESIDASDAAIARDLRLIVREKLVEGMNDDEIRTFLVDRYGEFVLFRPRFGGAGLVLWLLGPLIFLIGAFFALRAIRAAKPEDKARPG